MAEPMTDARLDEISALANAATPWITDARLKEMAADLLAVQTANLNDCASIEAANKAVDRVIDGLPQLLDTLHMVDSERHWFRDAWNTARECVHEVAKQRDDALAENDRLRAELAAKEA